MKEQVSQMQRNWYDSEVDEQIKVDSRDKVKRNKKSDQLLSERMMLAAEQE